MSKETLDPPLVMCVIESSPATSSPAPRVGVLCLASKSLADSLSLGGSASLFWRGALVAPSTLGLSKCTAHSLSLL